MAEEAKPATGEGVEVGKREREGGGKADAITRLRGSKGSPAGDCALWRWERVVVWRIGECARLAARLWR